MKRRMRAAGAVQRNVGAETLNMGIGASLCNLTADGFAQFYRWQFFNGPFELSTQFTQCGLLLIDKLVRITIEF